MNPPDDQPSAIHIERIEIVVDQSSPRIEKPPGRGRRTPALTLDGYLDKRGGGAK